MTENLVPGLLKLGVWKTQIYGLSYPSIFVLCKCSDLVSKWCPKRPCTCQYQAVKDGGRWRTRTADTNDLLVSNVYHREIGVIIHL